MLNTYNKVYLRFISNVAQLWYRNEPFNKIENEAKLLKISIKNKHHLPHNLLNPNFLSNDIVGTFSANSFKIT